MVFRDAAVTHSVMVKEKTAVQCFIDSYWQVVSNDHAKKLLELEQKQITDAYNNGLNTVINEKVEGELVKLMKDNPAKIIQYLILILGRECVKSNASEMDMSMDADIEDKRYKIIANVSVSETIP